jgi:radical SAM protein with 4Fe4S-binding SPASM domain
MKPRVQKIRDHYLVSSTETGAVSLFTNAEYTAFRGIYGIPSGSREAVLRQLLEAHGCTGPQADRFTVIFLKKLAQQGWFLEKREEEATIPLQHVYLTITTLCNLSCLYCYIGEGNIRENHRMDPADAEVILRKLRQANPRARIAITGGEPFTHPEIFTIMDLIVKHGFSFVIGTNATLIDEPCAEKLGRYGNLNFIQVSIDGMTPDVHAITRGETFDATMAGIRNLMKYRVSFALAPTLHEGNLHEMEELARFTRMNGGRFAPNHLRKFPHSPRVHAISLHEDSLRRTILESFEKTNREFGAYGKKKEGNTTSGQENPITNLCRTYVCGNGWSTADINWNGDVYPCHLQRETMWRLGNILEEEFPEILERGKKSPGRVRSHEIPKCRKCAFVATCAGGCRASAWYNRGTFRAEDEYCNILYKFEVDKLFRSKGIEPREC